MIPPTREHHLQATHYCRSIVSEDPEDYLILDEEEEETPKLDRERISLPKIGFPRLSKPRKEYDDEIEDQGQFMEDGFEITWTGLILLIGA